MVFTKIIRKNKNRFLFVHLCCFLKLTQCFDSVIFISMEYISALDYITKDTKIILKPDGKKKRIWEIDFIRGFCVLLMILDHLAIMIAYYFGPSWYGYIDIIFGTADSFTNFCYQWEESHAREIIHPIVLFLFFSISGISCTFSRSNLKRGLQLAIVATIYSLCTWFAEEVLGIYGVLTTFGVLNFLATCIILYAIIRIICLKNKWAVAAVSAAIIITSTCLYFLYSPPENTPLFFAIVFPPYDYYGNASLFYSQADFSPGDLFTLIPYISFFFAGTLIGPFLYSKKESLLPKLEGAWSKPVTFMGRYALLIYIIHVLIIAAILALVSYLFITPGSFGI